jgi:hypothetical protein
MKRCIGLTLAAVAAALMAACGGGGGGDEPAPGTGTGGTPTGAAPTTTAEGFWVGPTSAGFTANIAILENGETWGVYNNPSNGIIVGAINGQTVWNGTRISGSGSEFNIPSRLVSSSTYAGSFSPRTSIAITTAGGVQFNGVYQSNYEQPASLSALAGNFTGQAVTAATAVQSASVNVSSTGSIAVAESQGCSASGSAVPRPGGKNIFNVTVTFFGSTCALGNGGTATGVAYYDTATQNVLMLALNPAKTDGVIFIGVK